MTKVRTQDARAALKEIVGEQVETAAGPDGRVSKKDEARLEPFVARSSQALREAGGKGARVGVDALTTRAVADADQVWGKFNQSNATDARYLSRADLQAITREDPSLGKLSRLAVLRAQQGNPGPALARAAVEKFFSTFDFRADDVTGVRPLVGSALPGATMLDGKKASVRAKLSPEVLAAYDCYHRVRQADFGNVSLQKAKIDGHEVQIVYCATDGDPAFLEVFDKKGKPLTSARLNGDQLVGFDETFGRVRFHPTIVALDRPKQEGGLSEPAEQALAGQPPSDWPGTLQVTQGKLNYTQVYRLGALELPGTETSPFREVAAAAFEYLWESSLKFRLVGSQDPFLLGVQREGVLNVGDFTRTDGKTYAVAKWRDIDDGSYTLYFDRAANGRLKINTVQFDN